MSTRITAMVDKNNPGAAGMIERRFVAVPSRAVGAPGAEMSGVARAIGMRAGEPRAEGEAAAGRVIYGHAAVFSSPTTIDMGWERFEEVIAPGAFARAIREKQDVRCLFNHEPERVLGRTASGTLRISEDATGLAYECDAPDTSDGRDVVTLIDRGDITGSSFSFRAIKEQWEDIAGGGVRRTVLDADLFDVSPVTFPAYAEATVNARGMAEILEKRSAAGSGHAGGAAELEAMKASLEAMAMAHAIDGAELDLVADAENL